MNALERLLERRKSPRKRARVSCELLIGNHRGSGTVLDLSRDGLFVQTDAHLPRGVPIEVHLHFPEGQTVAVRATLAHWRRVARSLVSVARDGVGLRLRNAPEAYTRRLGRDAEPTPSRS
jgi:hypothetical protein